MKISVVTVCFNAAMTLGNTMESVLAQGYPDIEYIVVDGGSTDGTIDLIRLYERRFDGRMNWVSEPDRGIYDAMNKGVQMAKGEIVGILNADDFFSDVTVVERIARAFLDYAVEAVYGDVRFVSPMNCQKTVRYYSSKIFSTRLFRFGFMPAPMGPYGESKMRAEEYLMAQDWFDKEVYIFRPCMIHGPGNKGNLNLLFSVVRRGIPCPLGAFENRRSFTSIDNLTFILARVLDCRVASGVYHIADDEPLSTKGLIQAMCEAMGKRNGICRLPKEWVIFMARCGDWLKLPLNTARLNKLTENFIIGKTIGTLFKIEKYKKHLAFPTLF